MAYALELESEGDDLPSYEIFWRDHYEYLKDRGYTLRRRYEPGWTPSWVYGNKDLVECEDSCVPNHWVVLDATRDDGTYVTLKRVDLIRATQEIEIVKLLSSPEFAEDPKNHCVPILDIIEVDGSNSAFIVMPLLFFTGFAPFETIGEVLEYCRQIFEVNTCPPSIHY
ncbi:hypothetical protein H0H87_009032 [Tephrocybe sp. NHM501043]|nr:hypothetical protein H0H87_009032 [Tephrocybe sp. NHM501043]